MDTNSIVMTGTRIFLPLITNRYRDWKNKLREKNSSPSHFKNTRLRFCTIWVNRAILLTSQNGEVSKGLLWLKGYNSKEKKIQAIFLDFEKMQNPESNQCVFFLTGSSEKNNIQLKSNQHEITCTLSNSIPQGYVIGQYEKRPVRLQLLSEQPETVTNENITNKIFFINWLMLDEKESRIFKWVRGCFIIFKNPKYLEDGSSSNEIAQYLGYAYDQDKRMIFRLEGKIDTRGGLHLNYNYIPAFGEPVNLAGEISLLIKKYKISGDWKGTTDTSPEINRKKIYPIRKGYFTGFAVTPTLF